MKYNKTKEENYITCKNGSLKNIALGQKFDIHDAINEITDNALDANASKIALTLTENSFRVRSVEKHNVNKSFVVENILKIGNNNCETTNDGCVGRYGMGCKMAPAVLIKKGSKGTCTIYGRPQDGEEWCVVINFDYSNDVFDDGGYYFLSGEEIPNELRNSEYDFDYFVEGCNISKSEIVRQKMLSSIRYCSPIEDGLLYFLFNEDELVGQDVMYLKGPLRVKNPEEDIKYKRKIIPFKDNPEGFIVEIVELNKCSISKDEYIEFDMQEKRGKKTPSLIAIERSGLYIKYNNTLLSIDNPRGNFSKLLRGKDIQNSSSGLRAQVTIQDKRAYEEMVIGSNKSKVDINGEAMKTKDYDELYEYCNREQSRFVDERNDIVPDEQIKPEYDESINALIEELDCDFSVALANAGSDAGIIKKLSDDKTVVINYKSNSWIDLYGTRPKIVCNVCSIIKCMLFFKKHIREDSLKETFTELLKRTNEKATNNLFK